jgi:simple sugar transport system substrate-binding protein
MNMVIAKRRVKMKRILRLALVAVLCLVVPLAVFAQAKPFKIAVYVPGVTAGSPLYEQMVAGTERAVKEFPNASMKVIEAGFNQGEWQEKMTSLAATGEYDVIVTSNPAMPFITAEVAKSFPEQKFLHLDAYFAGHPQIYSMLYNQVEQAYFTGYLGGLVTKSSMPGANQDLKAGMVVAQEYPALTKMMKPGYEQGLQAVDPKITVDYRVIGNWYDANKAADLANSMIDAGVDVILTIAGGANQGVIKAAKEKGKYVLFFDSNEYKIAPGTIVGCAVLNQEKAAYERVKLAIQGKLKWGTAEVVNAKAGYVDFADADPLYTSNVPADVRRKMAEVVKKIRTGTLVLEVPQL